MVVTSRFRWTEPADHQKRGPEEARRSQPECEKSGVMWEGREDYRAHHDEIDQDKTGGGEA